jgi:hypothetical protein
VRGIPRYDAEHGDGEQVLGGELVGDFLPVPASTDPFEVRAGVDRAIFCWVFGEVPLHQAGSEVLIVAEPAGNVDGHDVSPCVVSANWLLRPSSTVWSQLRSVPESLGQLHSSENTIKSRGIPQPHRP